MFFIREVKYLYYYEKSKKRCSAGTCKCQMREGKMVLDVCLKKLPLYYPLKVQMYFTTGIGNQIVERSCEILQDKWEYQFKFSYTVKEEDCENLYFFFKLSSDRVICDEKTLFEYVTKKDTVQETIQDTIQDTTQNGVQDAAQNTIQDAIPNTIQERIMIEENDSQQQPEMYAASGQSVVHIPDVHGSKETYYVAEPKQLKGFGNAFAQFEENSFLLHGYYNYRHILVGPKSEFIGAVMRIGVPGNYYKREEVVAKMFGFLEFVPTKGEKKTGAFGYYYTTELPLENR